MHEFSIAVNIVDIVIEEAKKSGAKKVLEIELEIGKLSGVVYEAMEFAMESAIKETILEKADVVIKKTDGEGICNSCGNKFPVEQLFDVCPECGSFDIEITKGKELRVLGLVVE